ncbi:hypothetical protein [Paraconexibacter sp. AEG42_29]|uniref:hypothetical protein n=1 Tax=Paraconexibacter sp. AEG42_29 TaxID=2997339 RepID=UPI00339D3AAD
MSACGSDDAPSGAGDAGARTGAAAAETGAAPASPGPATTGTAPGTATAPQGTAAAPAATTGAPAADPATPSATAPAPPATTPAGAAGAPGGDEEGIRIPATFSVAPGRVTPAEVTVAPFLRVELRLSSGDGAAHRFTLRTPSPITVDVPATGLVTRTVDGLKPGSYEIAVDDGAAAGRLTAADDAVGP